MIGLFGRFPSGRAFRSNLFFVPQKRISTSIPNAKKIKWQQKEEIGQEKN